jgi:hypothetical protein
MNDNEDYFLRLFMTIAERKYNWNREFAIRQAALWNHNVRDGRIHDATFSIADVVDRVRDFIDSEIPDQQ